MRTKTIFLCFANDKQQSLNALEQEEEILRSILDQGNSQNHFIVRTLPKTTTRNIIRGINQYQKSLNLFLYSGHAGQSNLFLEDRAARAEGIAGLLKHCKSLDLVILNGCSTAFQAKKLMQLPSSPAVIATSAPVGDQVAAIFSETFFTALFKQNKKLSDAFDMASDATEVLRGIDVIDLNRVLDDNTIDDEQGVWGLYIPSNRMELGNWRPSLNSDIKENIRSDQNKFNINASQVKIIETIEGDYVEEKNMYGKKE